MVKSYIPERGDLVMVNFNPQKGREQAGSRPALVISRGMYNERSGLGLFCPITSHEKGYPFEVVIPAGSNVYGVILVDQVRALDWKMRGISFIARMPSGMVEEVIQKLSLLISSSK